MAKDKNPWGKMDKGKAKKLKAIAITGMGSGKASK